MEKTHGFFKIILFFMACFVIAVQSGLLDVDSLLSEAKNISEEGSESAYSATLNDEVKSEEILEQSATSGEVDELQDSLVPSDYTVDKNSPDLGHDIRFSVEGEGESMEQKKPEDFFSGSYSKKLSENDSEIIVRYYFDGKGSIRKEIYVNREKNMEGEAKYKFDEDRMVFYDIIGDSLLFPNEGERFIIETSFILFYTDHDEFKLERDPDGFGENLE